MTVTVMVLVVGFWRVVVGTAMVVTVTVLVRGAIVMPVEGVERLRPAGANPVGVRGASVLSMRTGGMIVVAGETWVVSLEMGTVVVPKE